MVDDKKKLNWFERTKEKAVNEHKLTTLEIHEMFLEQIHFQIGEKEEHLRVLRCVRDYHTEMMGRTKRVVEEPQPKPRLKDKKYTRPEPVDSVGLSEPSEEDYDTAVPPEYQQ